MGRRREQRVAITLPVRVSGRDFNNNLFSQECETLDITRNGCQLRWIACLRGPGDVVEVQYQKEKARFKVTWIGKEGTKREGHVGLRVLDNKYIWGVALPSPKPDDYILPEEPAPAAAPEPVTPLQVSFEAAWAGEDRRSAPRHRCTGNAEVVDPQTDTKVRGLLSDISLGGCYVDVMTPLGADTEVRARINAAGTTIETSAIVRASHPAMGMGLEFTNISPENQQRLEALMSQLAGQPAEAVPAAAAAPEETDRYSLSETALTSETPSPLPLPSPAQSFDSQLVLDTLLQLLYSKGVLTREEFLRALEKPASTTPRN